MKIITAVRDLQMWYKLRVIADYKTCILWGFREVENIDNLILAQYILIGDTSKSLN